MFLKECYTPLRTLSAILFLNACQKYEWSSRSIFSKTRGWDAKYIFFESDYVAKDPKSGTVMINPCGEAWEDLKLFYCRSHLQNWDCTPETWLYASIASTIISERAASQANYRALRAGFNKSIDAGIAAVADIARKEFSKIRLLSRLEERLQNHILKALDGTVTRELLHDLLSNVSRNEQSLRTSHATENYFRFFIIASHKRALMNVSSTAEFSMRVAPTWKQVKHVLIITLPRGIRTPWV